MSNHDQYRDENPFREISFQTPVDNDFCQAITETYQDADYRAILPTDYFFARVANSICTYRRRMATYEKVQVAPPDSDGVLLDGIIHGARLVPVKEYVEDEEEWGEFESHEGAYNLVQVPHAVMSDVVLLPSYAEPADQGSGVTDTDEKIWVPIYPSEGTITLYRPPEIQEESNG